MLGEILTEGGYKVETASNGEEALEKIASSVPALLIELVKQGRLAPDAWVVIERPATHNWSWPNGLASDADYRYGQTGISLGVYEPEKGSQ